MTLIQDLKERGEFLGNTGWFIPTVRDVGQELKTMSDLVEKTGKKRLGGTYHYATTYRRKH